MKTEYQWRCRSRLNSSLNYFFFFLPGRKLLSRFGVACHLYFLSFTCNYAIEPGYISLHLKANDDKLLGCHW